MKTASVLILFMAFSVLPAAAENPNHSEQNPKPLLDAPGPDYPGRAVENRLAITAPDDELPTMVIILGAAAGPKTIPYEKGMTIHSALRDIIPLAMIESAQLVRSGLRSEIADQDLRDPNGANLLLKRWDIILLQRKPKTNGSNGEQDR